MVIDLGIVGTIALLFLVLAGLYVFAKYFLYPFLDDVPGIGRWLRTHLEHAINRVRGTLTHWVEVGVRPLYDVFVLPIEKLGSWMDEAAVNLAGLAWWVNNLNSTKADKGSARNATIDINNLKSTIAQQKTRIQHLETTVQGLQKFVQQTLPRDIGQAIDTATGHLNNRLTADEQHLARGIDQVQNQARAAEQAAKHGIDQLQIDMQRLGQSFDTALQNLAGKVNGEVKSIEETVQDYMQKNLGKLSTDITDAAATAATAADIGIAAKIAIDDFLENCGRKLCETYGQQANELQNMMNFMNEGEFLALIEAAIAHPEETAKLFADAFTGTFEELSALLRNMGK
jgi:hypothetical protein